MRKLLPTKPNVNLLPVQTPPDRRRILVLNQYYWPGVEATAQLLPSSAEELAGEFDVTVVTAVLHRHETLPATGVAKRRRDRQGAIDVIRAQPAVAPRAQLRHLHGQRTRARPRDPRPDLVLCMTDPPMVGDVALAVARRFRRATRRRQRGRLPRDRGGAQAAREPAARRRCCGASCGCTCAGRTASSRSARRCASV